MAAKPTQLYPKFRRLYNKQMSDNLIAKQCGCSASAVHTWRRDNDLAPNYLPKSDMADYTPSLCISCDNGRANKCAKIAYGAKVYDEQIEKLVGGNSGAKDCVVPIVTKCSKYKPDRAERRAQ